MCPTPDSFDASGVRLDKGVYEPLLEYRDRYREAFSRNAREMFDELLAKSCVDPVANARTISEKNDLEANRAAIELKLFAARAMTWGLWAFAAVAVLCAVSDFMAWREGAGTAVSWLKIVLWLAGCAAAVVLSVKIGMARINRFKAAFAKLSDEIAEKEQEAWRQLSPLNALFDWDVMPRLIEKTVPRIVMDRRFFAGRLNDLRNAYGCSER